MISGVKKDASFDADDEETKKLLEIRKKIHDKDYVDYAVQRIATVLSQSLIENQKKKYFPEAIHK